MLSCRLSYRTPSSPALCLLAATTHSVAHREASCFRFYSILHIAYRSQISSRLFCLIAWEFELKPTLWWYRIRTLDIPPAVFSTNCPCAHAISCFWVLSMSFCISCILLLACMYGRIHRHLVCIHATRRLFSGQDMLHIPASLVSFSYLLKSLSCPGDQECLVSLFLNRP